MRFRSAMIMSCLMTAILSVPDINAQTRYYSVPSQEPIEIGSEVFQQKHISLRGLEGVYVDFSAINSAGADLDIEMPESLYEDSKEIIESAGLLFLDKEDVANTPGQPVLNLWPSYMGSHHAYTGAS